jgi:excisionase family DNA binding protein
VTIAKPDLAAVLTQLAEVLTTDATPPVPEPRRLPERVLLTVEEAAEQLRIGRTVAWRLVSSGELQSVQIGRLRRVPAAAVSEYAAHLVARQSRDLPA